MFYNAEFSSFVTQWFGFPVGPDSNTGLYTNTSGKFLHGDHGSLTDTIVSMTQGSPITILLTWLLWQYVLSYTFSRIPSATTMVMYYKGLSDWSYGFWHTSFFTSVILFFIHNLLIL